MKIRKIKKVSIFLALFLIVSLVGGNAAQATNTLSERKEVVIVTSLGKIKGVETGEVASFKGIPYGKAPIGELAFAPTKRYGKWDGVLDATDYGNISVQPKAYAGGKKMDEDCLNLNVWKPKDAKAGDKLPVYVYIHGGAFAVDSSANPDYSGESIARNGIVFVSMNYRLGMAGFLANKTTLDKYGTTGNWGLLDQIEALKWVKNNISSFGGDPDHVVIGGQSAGAISVSALMLSPLAKGLFKAAVMESGSVFTINAIADNGKGELDKCIKIGQDIMASEGIKDSASGLNEFRKMDIRKLTEKYGFSPDFTQSLKYLLFPTFDGYVLPKDPVKAIRSGDFNKVPILIGYNTNEGSAFVPEGNGLVNGETLELVRSYIGYLLFINPVKTFLDEVALKNVSAWGYHFDYLPESARSNGLGVRHSAEIPYIYGGESFRAKLPKDGYQVGLEMETRFVNFIKNYDPNKGKKAVSDVKWEKYSSANKAVYRIAQKPEMEKLR